MNDHSNDYDDIVPEFNEPVSALSEKKQEDNHKIDFQGEKYEEYYDEWMWSLMHVSTAFNKYLSYILIKF